LPIEAVSARSADRGCVAALCRRRSRVQGTLAVAATAGSGL